MAEGSGGANAMVNTGRKEKKQMDMNPNSPTFGQTRWIDAGVDLTLCPLPAVQIFGSLEIQRIVFRNNCGAGFIGGSVIYTVPAGAFTSYVSQADANQKAEDHFAATAQNYANTNANCIPENVSGSGGGDEV